MVSLAQSVADLLARSTSTGWRQATVQAVDVATGTLTLVMGGELVSGVPWQASAYSPVVGDRVTVMWDRGSGMFVTGTLSTVQATVPDQETVSVHYSDAGIITAISDEDGWGEPGTGFDMGAALQGNFVFSGPWPPGSNPPVVLWAYLSVWPDPSTLVPAGSTIDIVSLRCKRVDMSPGDDSAFPKRSPMQSPIVYAHNYTLASLPPAGQEPPWVDGPWEPGALAIPTVLDPVTNWGANGDEATFRLPQSWADGLVDGSITGTALWTPNVPETAAFDLSLVVTYTPPPEDI